MGNYRDLEQCIRTASQMKILILDTGNIQFFYQNRDLLPHSFIFNRYDLVLIPGWVHAEYAHHSGKSGYIASLPKPYFIVDEVDDYLPMLGYSDKKLMELFRLAAPNEPSQRFFNLYKGLGTEDYPDDWIEQYYEQGFFTRETQTMITKKNAGEVSILTLCFALLSHYPTQLSNIAIASSDLGIVNIKDRMVLEAHKTLTLGTPISPPISYFSKDVLLFLAVKEGIIHPHQISTLRPNPSSSTYVESFPNGTTVLHRHLLHTSDFEEICRNYQRYQMIF